MPNPTWNGKNVETGSPEFHEAATQAWEVYKQTMRGPSFNRLSTEELLHAVEASAWLERLAAAARHSFVPAAKASGASWQDLGAAMGVSRATAQHRYKQEAEEWEEGLRQASASRP